MKINKSLIKIPKLKLNIRPVIIIVLISLFIGTTIYFFLPESLEEIVKIPMLEPQTTEEKSDYLVLPFKIDQIDTVDGTFSPFGVYRKTGDQIGYGHSGIDVPLIAGANIYAPKAGKVVLIERVSDGRPGYNLKIIFEGSKPTEGWGFFYEHINPLENIKVGTNVAAGQQIGKTALGKYANNHFELSYWFSNYNYAKDAQCWIEKLNPKDKTTFENFFNEQSMTQQFINAWETATEENKLTYKGLLDATKYPNGPQLCYPKGTDGRISL